MHIPKVAHITNHHGFNFHELVRSYKGLAVRLFCTTIRSHNGSDAHWHDNTKIVVATNGLEQSRIEFTTEVDGDLIATDLAE